MLQLQEHWYTEYTFDGLHTCFLKDCANQQFRNQETVVRTYNNILLVRYQWSGILSQSCTFFLLNVIKTCHNKPINKEEIVREKQLVTYFMSAFFSLQQVLRIQIVLCFADKEYLTQIIGTYHKHLLGFFPHFLKKKKSLFIIWI